MSRDRRGDEDAVRITTAATSRNEDIRARQRRYLFSMAVRTACFVAAVIVGHGVVMWVLIAAAVFLPYVAVVMANAAASRSDDFALQGSAFDKPELGAGPSSPEAR
jgi:fatty acid desaturase